MLSSFTLLRSASMCVLLACAARGDFVVHVSTPITDVPIGGSAQTTLPQFDASLGVLRQVRISVFCTVSGTLGFENLTTGDIEVGGYFSGTYAGALAPWQIAGYSGASANPAFLPPPVVLAPYDGATDFSGASGVTHVFTHESGDGSPGQSVMHFMDAALSAFAGTGTIDAIVGPIASSGPYVSEGIVASTTLSLEAQFAVRYDFDPLPASICRALSFSGCPCGNSSPVGYGCGNSGNPNGGRLAASGTASIANDTLRLQASGMTNSNSLFFQGSGLAYAQVPYGDGLRCVTGNLLRIGTRSNVAGAAEVPSAGEPPISVQGQITQPGTRTYQVFYRDAQEYCTSATNNVTSGLAILWGA